MRDGRAKLDQQQNNLPKQKGRMKRKDDPTFGSKSQLEEVFAVVPVDERGEDG